MSLINDALRNAHKKADQPRQSPVDGLTLRPPETGLPARRNLWLIPAAAGLAFALLAIVAVNFYLHRNSISPNPSAENLTVNARESTPVARPGAALTKDSASAAPGKEPAPKAPMRVESPVAAEARTAVAVTPAPPAAAVSPPSTSPPIAASPNVQPAAAPAPSPEPLRLQAIVYHPSRPSAVISGKAVFVGERVQGMKVISITKESATVSGNGRNLVLTLPE